MADFYNMKRLPSRGKPGDVYRDATSKRLYLCLGDGTLCDIADLLSESRPAVRVVGPQGETGRPGADSQVPGLPGRDGKDGKDSTVPGPSGPKGERGISGQSIVGPRGEKGDSIVGPVGPQGPRGEKGDRGDVLYVGPEEMEAATKAARAQLIDQRARFMAAIAQALQDSGSIQHEQYRYRCRMLIEQVRREAGL
jgi:hypothetical protein